MSKNKIMIMAAGVLVAASCAVPAWAEPAPIDDGSGPRSVGAQIEDGSGTPGPSFDEPVSIPSVGDAPTKPGPGATPAEIKAYEKALAAHEAQVQARDRAVALEHARQEAQRQQECAARGITDEPC